MQTIQWFPGHMAKAKREITEKVKLVDLIIELKDARIPYASTNPMISEIIGNKPRLILLCKSSLADPFVTKAWMEYYASKNIISLDIDSITGYHTKDILKYANIALKEVFEKRQAKGITSKTIKAMILGIPNVGKSTLINTLAKRKATTVGDRPGVTKNQTWIKISDALYLLDTPGILWPKFEDQEVGLKLAMCGSIKDEILDLNGLVLASLDYISKNYPEYIKNRYKIEINDSESMQEQIGKSRGFLSKGGIVDLERTNRMFINELRGMKIGAMSYERPEDQSI
ncbi:MAG: ribosome biogenesis GTPase YlqF [Anaeroplasmataceae bacterium]|nr:ribosome biogenesis GTPase YlqF [Anaeroplasmataceae bacterium]